MRVSVTFGGLEYDQDAEWLRFDLIGKPDDLVRFRDDVIGNNHPDLQSFESRLEDQFGSMDGCPDDLDLTAYQAHECPVDKQIELIEALRTWFRETGRVGVGPVYRVTEKFTA